MMKFYMYKKLIPFFSLVLLFTSMSVFSLETKSPGSYQNRYSQNFSEIINALDITRTKYKNKSLLNNSSSISLYNLEKIKEYKIFINYLSFQINNYCEQIINNSGVESVQDLKACYSNNEFSNANIQTSEEKITILEDELMYSLGEFDEMLLLEDEKIAQNKKNKAQNNGGILSGEDNNPQIGTKIKKQSMGNRHNNSVNGTNQQKKTKKYQRRKLVIDDDIVERQLKEAAETEINHELKEKLWNEYYKYKK